MSSVGVTLAGGQSTIVSCFMMNTSDQTFFLTSDGTWITLDVLSAGLDAGYAVGLVFIFFALQYPRNGTIGQNSIQKWWGNTVYMNTADYQGVPLKSLPDGGKFGPSRW